MIYQKYIKISTREGYDPTAWKLAQVQELKEYQLKIRADKDQDIVSHDEVSSSNTVPTVL